MDEASRPKSDKRRGVSNDELTNQEMLCVSLPFKFTYDEVKDVIKEACLHQLDKCQAHYEPLITEIQERQAELLKKMNDIDLAITQAGEAGYRRGATEKAKEIIASFEDNLTKWGNYMPKQVYKELKTQLGQGCRPPHEGVD